MKRDSSGSTCKRLSRGAVLARAAEVLAWSGISPIQNGYLDTCWALGARLRFDCIGAQLLPGAPFGDPRHVTWPFGWAWLSTLFLDFDIGPAIRARRISEPESPQSIVSPPLRPRGKNGG